jgi:hypothetical protein
MIGVHAQTIKKSCFVDLTIGAHALMTKDQELWEE